MSCAALSDRVVGKEWRSERVNTRRYRQALLPGVHYHVSPSTKPKTQQSPAPASADNEFQEPPEDKQRRDEAMAKRKEKRKGVPLGQRIKSMVQDMMFDAPGYQLDPDSGEWSETDAKLKHEGRTREDETGKKYPGKDPKPGKKTKRDPGKGKAEKPAGGGKGKGKKGESKGKSDKKWMTGPSGGRYWLDDSGNKHYASEGRYMDLARRELEGAAEMVRDADRMIAAVTYPEEQ